MASTRFERTERRNIRIHVLPTDRFKTYAVSLYVGGPLTGETVTPNALVPFILRRGTQAYPDTKAYRERLDELYGAGFGFDVYKRGNNQIVQFRMDTVADRYAGASADRTLLRETLVYLLQTLATPALEDGKFVRKYVESEITTVRKKLESIINDKIRYAAQRCTQEMFPDDPFRFDALGRLEQLEQLDADRLYARYEDWLRHAQIDLYVVGDTTLEEVSGMIEQELTIDRGALHDYRFAAAAGEGRASVHTVVERLDVSQGKLNMGLSIPVLYGDDAYPAALMYNGVLGSYPHSKLFTNVREKASLAYYASSRLDGYKGMLMIQSGIETANYDKAVQIIREQLNALAAGDISDLELSQTRAMMTNQLREVNDSAFEMIGFDFNAVLTGVQRSIPSVIASIESVTAEQIAAIAERVRLDTIYFLRDRKGE